MNTKEDNDMFRRLITQHTPQKFTFKNKKPNTTGYIQLNREYKKKLKTLFHHDEDKVIRQFFLKMNPIYFQNMLFALEHSLIQTHELRFLAQKLIDEDYSANDKKFICLFSTNGLRALEQKFLSFAQMVDLIDNGNLMLLLSDNGLLAMSQHLASFQLAKIANSHDLHHYLSEKGQHVIKNLLRDETLLMGKKITLADYLHDPEKKIFEAFFAVYEKEDPEITRPASHSGFYK